MKYVEDYNLDRAGDSAGAHHRQHASHPFFGVKTISSLKVFADFHHCWFCPAPSPGGAHSGSLGSYLVSSTELGQIRTQPAEVSQGHWSSGQAGLGFYTDLAAGPDICHRLLSLPRTCGAQPGQGGQPRENFAKQKFFL